MRRTNKTLKLYKKVLIQLVHKINTGYSSLTSEQKVDFVDWSKEVMKTYKKR